MNPSDTHKLICDFGRHKGTPYTRLPVSYLKWMINARHSEAKIAQAELERRGTVTDHEIDVSGHALDRASLNCLDVWKKTRQREEGIYAWLHRVARAAIEAGEKDRKGRYVYEGLLFAVDHDGVWPVLKTVMRPNQEQKGQRHGR